MVIAPWLTRRTPDNRNVGPNTDVEPVGKVSDPLPVIVPEINRPLGSCMEAAPVTVTVPGSEKPLIPLMVMAPLSVKVPVKSTIPGPVRLADPAIVTDEISSVPDATLIVPSSVRGTASMALSLGEPL